MNRVLLPFPPQRPLAQAMAPTLHARVGRLDWRRFPDGESLVTLDAALDGAHVAIMASLDRADRISVPLRFAADTARELGARSVGLVAPYLGYMRQDARFHAGEAVGARSYARFLQQAFDWLATVDPHLHRIRTLAELFPMPATQASAAPLLAQWIRAQVRDPVLVGPDAESAQWVAQVATACDAPWLTLRKQRRGDRDVAIDTGADLALLRGRSLVLVDDIVSTGETLVRAGPAAWSSTRCSRRTRTPACARPARTAWPAPTPSRTPATRCRWPACWHRPAARISRATRREPALRPGRVRAAGHPPGPVKLRRAHAAV